MKKSGFTLIELSIVLVIIGLIVGGVLVGRDLIKAAEVRAQVSQIEKMNSAVNTFRGKFGAIPGDMLPTTVTQFGFTVGAGCDGINGKRDGNGLLHGWAPPQNMIQGTNETGLFWQDLSSSVAGGLIEGVFPNSGAAPVACSALPGTLTTTPGSSFIGAYLPAAKIGNGAFLYVYEVYGTNWFGLSTVTTILNTNGVLYSNPTLTVSQAYALDAKIDDGFPLRGNVQAFYINGSQGLTYQSASSGGASSTTCFDTTSNQYSIGQNNGNGVNCSLSFKFQ